MSKALVDLSCVEKMLHNVLRIEAAWESLP